MIFRLVGTLLLLRPLREQGGGEGGEEATPSARLLPMGRVPPSAPMSVKAVDKGEETSPMVLYAAIAELAQATSAPFHVDAVQAAHLPLDLDVSAISFSGHKVGAPKGIGALWSKAPLEPVIHGGGQEKGRRSGTENVAGAVAFATALELAREELFPDLSGFITSALEIEGAQLSGHPTMRLPGHASFVFEGTGAETVLLELERLGVICSPGSACSQGEVSHVLLGLGYSEDLARTSVRFTFSASHTPEDVDFAAQALKSAVATVRSSFSPH